ncbi:MAG: glutamate--tRNA ligase [Anaerolineaceae bacterium]|nr:glutamate--tRNA ligase [Anaerolineaceae bacterium]
MSPARPVRVRFAPSPTGPLHIGGLRTALFNWLYARHHGGRFILRLEDTDQRRLVSGSAEHIMAMLRHYGLDYDEGPDIGGAFGPYVQSERRERHVKRARWLVQEGAAYPCYCSAERLKAVNAEKRKRGEASGYDRHCRDISVAQRAELEAAGVTPVIRFRMPLEGQTVVRDAIRGESRFDNSRLQDTVLLKSDGFPTYHLAHLVDDQDMQITHVLRSSEWLPSLPLHWQLWQAFGQEKPVYVHLPVLLNPNGKGKLSKRHAGFTQNGRQVLVLAQEFINAGYLPEAVGNFLTNIGWSMPDEREFFPVEAAIEGFELSRVNPADSVFPVEKLDWLNGMWIRELSGVDLAQRVRPLLQQAGLEVDDALLRKVVPLMQERMRSLHDFAAMAGFFFSDSFAGPEADAIIQRRMDTAGTLGALQAARQRLEEVERIECAALEADMRALAQELGIKAGQLFGSLRVAVTGQRVSPPLFETMEILGLEICLERIDQAIATLQRQA